jgi:CubicO group peptidase (beta-lactamase class C family)
MPELGGTCDPRFERVHAALAANIDTRVESGASIYVEIDGEPVVDLWGGWRDQERMVPWTEDTIVNLWSTTKNVTSLAVLTLVDRGEIDLYTPVAHYWPEFSQNGKDRIQVRHLLSHTSGVSGWEQPFRVEDEYDLEASTAKLARQAPWWEPGTASGYHASTFGHLNGELVRRVTGKTLGRFIADEIAGPLEADFHIGLDDIDFGRVASLCLPAGVDFPDSPPYLSLAPSVAETVAGKTLAGTASGVFPNPAVLGNTPEWRRAEIGASNGHSNARGVGRILSAITHDGVSRGVQLLSPKTIDLIFEEQADGIDLFLNRSMRWGIGYGLAPDQETGSDLFIRPGSKTCYWGGWGGSIAIMDVDRHVTFCYAPNQMHVGDYQRIRAEYCNLVYAGLDRS